MERCARGHVLSEVEDTPAGPIHECVVCDRRFLAAADGTLRPIAHSEAA